MESNTNNTSLLLSPGNMTNAELKILSAATILFYRSQVLTLTARQVLEEATATKKRTTNLDNSNTKHYDALSKLEEVLTLKINDVSKSNSNIDEKIYKCCVRLVRTFNHLENEMNKFNNAI